MGMMIASMDKFKSQILGWGDLYTRYCYRFMEIRLDPFLQVT